MVAQSKAAKTTKKPKEELCKEAQEIGTITRKEYEEMKAKALEFERKRYGKYILLVPCDGNKGWCEMGDVSALLYRDKICQRLRVKVNMSDDKEKFFGQYDLGRIRTRGYDTVRRRLKQAKVYEREETRGKCKIFVLNHEFTKEEIDILWKMEQARQAKANNIVHVDMIDPEVYRGINNVMLKIGTSVESRMTKIQQRIIGEKIYGRCEEIFELYFAVAEKSEKKPKGFNKTAWEKMRSLGRMIIVELQIIAVQKIWEKAYCVKIGDEVEKLIEQIERNIAKC